MQVRLDTEGEVLLLAFREAAAAMRYLEEIRSSGGLLVSLGRRLDQYDVVDVKVALGSDEHEAFRAYAARITDREDGSFDTAFVLQDWSEDCRRDLLERLAAPARATEPGVGKRGQAEPDRSPGDSSVVAEGETRGVAAVHRIREMTMGQKAILAQRATRSERQVLLRDTAPQVLQALLTNPRIEATEILQIAKSTHATEAILHRVGADARWGKNQEILAAVVRNQRAPTLLATRLVDKLRTSDLRFMAKMSSGLKEVLRKAALREYLKRSGQK